jgi:hypothetical protein
MRLPLWRSIREERARSKGRIPGVAYERVHMLRVAEFEWEWMLQWAAMSTDCCPDSTLLIGDVKVARVKLEVMVHQLSRWARMAAAVTPTLLRVSSNGARAARRTVPGGAGLIAVYFGLLFDFRWQ